MKSDSTNVTVGYTAWTSLGRVYEKKKLLLTFLAKTTQIYWENKWNCATQVHDDWHIWFIRSQFSYAPGRSLSETDSFSLAHDKICNPRARRTCFTGNFVSKKTWNWRALEGFADRIYQVLGWQETVGNTKAKENTAILTGNGLFNKVKWDSFNASIFPAEFSRVPSAPQKKPISQPDLHCLTTSLPTFTSPAEPEPYRLDSLPAPFFPACWILWGTLSCPGQCVIPSKPQHPTLTIDRSSRKN